jgi:[acyl-carrier-protein] S-malonyltransferase
MDFLLRLMGSMKKFAFLFPGQGSQSVGMLDAWGDHPAVRRTLQEASGALGEDIAKLIHEGPKEVLSLTTNTQPAMLVAGVAAYRVWMQEVGIAPEVVAGHSLGEYTALVAAEALTLEEAAPLVRLRARAMQEAVPVGAGAMAAILGLEAARVIAGCNDVTASFGTDATEVVEAVNFNEPAQTVIAGTHDAVGRACEFLKSAGARRVMLLPVSAPFHSSLMKPAAEALRERLQTVALQAPKIPLINNIDVIAESDPQHIRDALYRQAFGPVRWVECVLSLKARGLEVLVECGPGKVLSGMVRRIDDNLRGLPMFDGVTLQQAREALV